MQYIIKHYDSVVATLFTHTSFQHTTLFLVDLPLQPTADFLDLKYF